MFEAIYRVSTTETQPLSAITPQQALCEARSRICGDLKHLGPNVELLAVRCAATGQLHPVQGKNAGPPSGSFDVHWTIRVEAPTAIDGASCARFVQFDPESPHSTYRVCDSQGFCQVIDLQVPDSRH